METIQVTSGKEFRRKNLFIVKVDDDLTVKMRRLDMATMLINGLLPLPMVRAAQKFEKLQESINSGNEGENSGDRAMNAIAELGDGGFLEMLRKYAAAAVVEPRIVLDNSGGEDSIPAEMLSLDQLLTIWNNGKDGRLLTNEQAEEFRRPESGTPGDDVPAGNQVRPEAQLVDHVERETISY